MLRAGASHCFCLHPHSPRMKCACSPQLSSKVSSRARARAISLPATFSIEPMKKLGQECGHNSGFSLTRNSPFSQENGLLRLKALSYNCKITKVPIDVCSNPFKTHLNWDLGVANRKRTLASQGKYCIGFPGRAGGRTVVGG